MEPPAERSPSSGWLSRPPPVDGHTCDLTYAVGDGEMIHINGLSNDNWSDTGGYFRVDVEVVPEPGSIVLALGGVGVLIVLRRRARQKAA